MAHPSWGERLLASPLRFCCAPLWLLYRPLIWLRNRSFDLGWSAQFPSPLPTICVGNLSMGGTGKTPLVNYICTYLQEQGHNPAIISRGYKGDETGNDEAQLMCRSSATPTAQAAQAAPSRS